MLDESLRWFITGAGEGLGKEVARKLLQAGASVFGTVLYEDEGEEIAMEFPSFSYAVLDLSSTDDLREKLERIIDRNGPFDVLFSNAGYMLYGAAEEASEFEIEHYLKANLIGPMILIETFLPSFRMQNGGLIIQMGGSGRVGEAGRSLYHTAKFGLTGFVESLREEVKPFGIKAVIVETSDLGNGFYRENAKVMALDKTYDNTPAHSFLEPMGKAPSSLERLAFQISRLPSRPSFPTHIVYGLDSLNASRQALKNDLRSYTSQVQSAARIDLNAKGPGRPKKGEEKPKKKAKKDNSKSPLFRPGRRKQNKE